MVRTFAWLLALGALGFLPAVASAQAGGDTRTRTTTETRATTDGRARSMETDREYRARTTREYETTRADTLGPEAGDWELILVGSGDNDHDFDNGAFSAQFQLGYYLTDELEVAVRQSVGFATTTSEVFDETTSTFIESSNDVWIGSSALAIDYHFNLGAFRPFIGASAGFQYGDSDTDCDFFLGPEAGVKWYVKDDTFIFAQAQYRWLHEERFRDGSFQYSLGIGFNF